jgi:hypothetical protein
MLNMTGRHGCPAANFLSSLDVHLSQKIGYPQFQTVTVISLIEFDSRCKT